MVEISPADAHWTGSAFETSGSLTELDEDECFALLATVPVGRVLVSVAALPSAFPVNHQVVDRTVVFRSTAGTKLTAAVDGQVVRFEADAFDPVTRSGWSVVLVGPAAVVDEAEQLRRLAELGLDTWYNHPTLYVRITPERITGRRITPSAVPMPPA